MTLEHKIKATAKDAEGRLQAAADISPATTG
jgi:hypothetical protein